MLTVALMIASCATPIGNLTELDPIDVHCEPSCFVECADVPPMPYGMTTNQLVIASVKADADLDACNNARRDCVDCIRLARRLGRIR